MLLKNKISLLLAGMAFIYSCVLITSCTNEEKKPDVSEVNVNLEVKRFEQDFFSLDTINPSASFQKLKQQYGSFLDLYLYQITTLGTRDSSLTLDHVTTFVKDTNFRAVLNECEKRFPDFEKEKQSLTQAFRYYHYYFPEKVIPRIVTLLSAFSYPVVCDSTNLGIGIDMYLGSDFRYYSTLEPPLPNFIRLRMRPEYLVSDAMRGWAMSDYAIDESSARLIDMMISEGRMMYFLKKVLPDENDTILTGYSSTQLKWCKENEKKVWSFFIDKQLLFSVDPNILLKYAAEGPTTNGFPKESPGNIGRYIGWQIVKSYMKTHPQITLQQLMEQKDLQKVYGEAGYKPLAN